MKKLINILLNLNVYGFHLLNHYQFIKKFYNYEEKNQKRFKLIKKNIQNGIF